MHNICNAHFCIAHICKHSLTGTQQAIVEKHQQCCNNTQASRQISAMKATGIPDSSRTPPPKGNLPTRHQPGPQPGLAVGPYTSVDGNDLPPSSRSFTMEINRLDPLPRVHSQRLEHLTQLLPPIVSV